MFVLRIQHRVPSWERWQQAFASDPAGRREGGVRRYRVMRALDDPLLVLIDLEFESGAEAEAFLARMRTIWRRVEGTIITGPSARIAELVEAREP